VLVGFNKGTEGVVSTCFNLKEYFKFSTLKKDEKAMLESARNTELQILREKGVIFTDNTLTIPKPLLECGEKACLCLYIKDGLGLDVVKTQGFRPVAPCSVIDGVDAMYSIRPYPAEGMKSPPNAMFQEFRGQRITKGKLEVSINSKIYPKSELVIYGKCEILAPEYNDLLSYGYKLEKAIGLGVINLDIEKQQVQEKTYLILSESIE